MQKGVAVERPTEERMEDSRMVMREIRLRIPTPGRERDFVEKLVVDELGANRFRLVHTAGLIEGLVAGDEFEIVDGGAGFRILSRGGNVGVWFYFPDEDQNRGFEARRLADEIVAIGGRLDGGGHTSLVFTIPVTVGFEAIEEVLETAQKRISGASWMYSNVYDSVDGMTPLNWWNEVG